MNDERIPVSREVFQAVCKENNHIRYLARCEKRCMQARYFMCPGDCLLCPWHRRGIFENPDGIDNTPFLLNQRDVEEEMILRETASAVYSFADRLVKDGSAILKMRFVCGCSCREIAREMGERYGVKFLYRDFRPGFRAGQQEARELGFYMQKYCGCVFSEEERYLKQLQRDMKEPLKYIG